MTTPTPAFVPEHVFEAELEHDGEKGGVYITIPFNVAEVYGTRGQVKVQVTFDGFPYRGSIVPMGDGQHLLGVPKQIRNAIEKTWGHHVHVELARDTEPRMAEIPEDFARVLAGTPGSREKLEQMAFSHQREYTRWIEAAKKTETRYERMKKAVEMIMAGRKRS